MQLAFIVVSAILFLYNANNLYSNYWLDSRSPEDIRHEIEEYRRQYIKEWALKSARQRYIDELTICNRMTDADACVRSINLQSILIEEWNSHSGTVRELGAPGENRIGKNIFSPFIGTIIFLMATIYFWREYMNDTKDKALANKN